MITLLAEDNKKLLEKLKLLLKHTINWNKSKYKVSAQGPDQYLDDLEDRIFQLMNAIFVLQFEDTIRTWHTWLQFDDLSKNFF